MARLVIPGSRALPQRVVEIGGEADETSLGNACSTKRGRRAIAWAPLSNALRRGVPAGWGAPVYAKLDAELGAAGAWALMRSRGLQVGEGFGAARLRGSENADAMRNLAVASNQRHAGGIARWNLHGPGNCGSGRPSSRRRRIRVHGVPRPLRSHALSAGGRGDDGAGACRSQTAPRSLAVRLDCTAEQASRPGRRAVALARFAPGPRSCFTGGSAANGT